MLSCTDLHNLACRPKRSSVAQLRGWTTRHIHTSIIFIHSAVSDCFNSMKQPQPTAALSQHPALWTPSEQEKLTVRPTEMIRQKRLNLENIKHTYDILLLHGNQNCLNKTKGNHVNFAYREQV